MPSANMLQTFSVPEGERSKCMYPCGGLLMIRVVQVVTATRNEGGAAKEMSAATVLNRGDVLYREK